MLQWIGRADDGTWIGLDNVNGGYVLLPLAGPPSPFRITRLPEDVCILSSTARARSVVFQLGKTLEKGRPAAPSLGANGPPTVTIRFRAPAKPEDIKTESSKRDAKDLFSDSGADMLSDALLSLAEVPGSRTADGSAYDVKLPLYENVEIVYGK